MAYEHMTPDKVRQDILDNTGIEVSKVEGSFASDMAAPVALEISKAYGEIDRSLTIMFVVGLEGELLDQRAGEYGIERKPGTKAAGSVTIIGVSGTLVPRNTIVMTDDGLRYLTNEDVTLVDGRATVGVTAHDVGVQYNIPAGAITRFWRNISNIESVTNEEAIIGGSDTETDDALKERLLVRMRTPATSGNVYHYINWATEVNGVGAAKVTPLWDGPGTVRVLIVGHDNKPVSDEIVEACYNHIEEERPIGADVTVVSATAQDITITANVQLSTGALLADVQSRFTTIVEAYLASIAFVEYLISYNQIAYLLMSIREVLDYSDLQINGGTSNITIAEESVPVLEGVTLNAV